jgi:hypothetical protein
MVLTGKGGPGQAHAGRAPISQHQGTAGASPSTPNSADPGAVTTQVVGRVQGRAARTAALEKVGTVSLQVVGRTCA